MNSLSDPSNFGARPVDTQRFYGSEPAGEGRWVMLDRLGLLWTDDREALQLDVMEGVDNDAANELRRGLNRSAAAGVPASTAFDTVVAERGTTPVKSGDLSRR